MPSTLGNTESYPDIVIVGAGLGGIYQLHLLKSRGYSVQVFEAGGGLGGIWHWSGYPGARVDSNVPLYEYSIDELWKDWTWTTKFPDRDELLRYFAYVDRKLDISPYVRFNTRVVGAEFDLGSNRWAVRTDDGDITHSRYLILCTAFASKPYIPSFKGLEKFQGLCHHTSRWPQEGIDLKGKRVGVIGTGASGVQVVQECAPAVSQLVVFQRTPNLALPMNQVNLSEEDQKMEKEQLYRDTFRLRRTTSAGFNFNPIPSNTLDVSEGERRAAYEGLWTKGGFSFWLANYADLFTDEKGNDCAYAFWREKVLERINDPVRQEILAPSIPPHPFGGKRPSLELNYYEAYNQSNVDLIDLLKNPIVEITETGVLTCDGVAHDLDVLIMATGFDALTGGITQIDIKGTDGRLIREKWSERVKTYLGLTTANYPNMFILYGPQGPTAFCNGPTCIVSSHMFSAII